jgi:hypothetical protein
VRDFSAGTFEFCGISSRYSSRRGAKSCGGFPLAASAPALARSIYLQQVRHQ